MKVSVDKERRRILVTVPGKWEEELTFAEAYQAKLQLDKALEELVEEVVHG